METFPILYKYSSKGQVQQWQIFVDANTFYTVEGIVGGKLTQSLPTYCKGKNIGKTNETSPEQQALAEARSKHQKKLDTSYNEVLTTERSFFEPMLAHEDKKYKKLLFTVPTFIQPKLDGLRAINEDNALTSRGGKAYVSCPHLHQNVTILDGELYAHQYADDFNKIVSLCKQQKPDERDLAESAEKVEYWVYDFPSHNGVFSERYEALKTWLAYNTNPKYVLVPTYLVNNQEELEKYHEQFLSEGYEGSIVRLDLGPYENKRSKQLLKKKDFVDAEFEIVDLVEGKGGRAGTVGRFTMRLADGREFGSNVKGDFKYLSELFKNREELIGKTATVKYFMLTPDGIPRFPVIIKLNRADYE